jgi:acyl dehydratase
MQVDKEHYRKSADGALGHKGLGHLDPVTAAETGMPGPYDNGWQRVSNVSHLVTDWMGDHGFLKKLSARLVRPNVFGDVWMLSGEVTEKSIVDGESIVYLKISGMNQLGEETTTGVAAVRLPSRNNR